MWLVLLLPCSAARTGLPTSMIFHSFWVSTSSQPVSAQLVAWCEPCSMVPRMPCVMSAVCGWSGSWLSLLHDELDTVVTQEKTALNFVEISENASEKAKKSPLRGLSGRDRPPAAKNAFSL